MCVYDVCVLCSNKIFLQPLVQIRVQKESISPLTNSEYRHLKNSLLPEVSVLLFV